MRAAFGFAVLSTLVAQAAFAQQRAPVMVTPGSEQTYRVAAQRFADTSEAPDEEAVQQFRDTLLGALEYSSVFRGIDEAAYLGPITSDPMDGAPALVCTDWSQIGVDVLIGGEIVRGAKQFSVSFEVWDTARCASLLRRRYAQSTSTNPFDVARRIADDIVELFVGQRGVASTEIAFVSDRNGSKEVFVMGADGRDARAATANRSINNFPDWSPDGNSILYTSYRHRNSPFLFITGRAEGQRGRFLSRLGDDRALYRGVFGPDGERIAVVLSDEGEASDIFTVRRDGTRLKRLTNSRAIEVSPAWSPDGDKIAFVSDRAGAPQIYIMDADGKNPHRLTFNGSYNTHPSWSPDGNWIAYETRVNAQFDIWLIDPDGEVNIPLVTHPRSDESPSWSPNSRKLLFSSTRRGRADIYVIGRDGSNLRRLTESAGNNTSPAWGPFPR
jgi:TolB protein